MTPKSLQTWREKNPEKLKQIKAREYLKNKDKYKNSTFLRSYGITFTEYDRMAVLQDYKCKICGIHEDELTRKLAVDHCHATGQVRGLLCLLCNSALGKFKDNKEILSSAIHYLEIYE